MSEQRNPLVIPDHDPTKGDRRVCPKCTSKDYNGNRHGDMIDYRCNSCGNTWQSGLPREPFDPRKPIPPISPKDKPPVDFAYNSRTKEIEELRRPVDLTQEFRKGALVTGEDDYNEW